MRGKRECLGPQGSQKQKETASREVQSEVDMEKYKSRGVGLIVQGLRSLYFYREGTLTILVAQVKDIGLIRHLLY